MTENRFSHGQKQPNIKIELPKGRERAMSLPAALHYNQEIAHHSKMKQYELACQTFDSMIHSSIAPDVVTYNTMINVFVKTLRLPDAFRLFEDMKKSGIEPTIVTYTSLIDGCGKCNKFGYALILYADVKKLGIPLNMHFFNAILNAGLLNGNIYIVEGILRDVATSNLRPNTVTYNTLLNGYARFGQLIRMKEIVQRMIADAVEFSPVTQTTILQAVQLATDNGTLRQFCDLLEAAKFIPSKTQASQAVMDLIDAKRLALAQQLLSYMLSRNFFINEDVFSSMVRLSGHFANLTILQWSVDAARNYGVPIQNDIFNAHIELFCKFGNAERVKELYTQAGDNHKLISMSSKISAVQCLISSGESRLLSVIVDQIFGDGLPMTEAEADRLIQIYFLRELYADVISIFNRLKKSKFSIGTRGYDQAAISSVRLKSPESIAPYLNELTISPYAAIEFICSSMAAEIKKLSWNAMISSWKTLPHPHVVQDLMNALLTKNLNTISWAVFEHFLKIGFEPTPESISLGFLSLRDSPVYEDMMTLYNAARDAEIPLSSEIYSSVVISSLKNGDLAEALALRDEMVAASIPLTREAESLYSSVFETAKFAFPAPPTPSPGISPRPIRTRKRSSTCPRMHLPADIADYEDSSFNSVLSYNDDEEL